MNEQSASCIRWGRVAAAGWLMAAGLMWWGPSSRAEYRDQAESAAPDEAAAEKAWRKQLLDKLDEIVGRQQAFDKRLDQVMEELRIIKLRARLSR
jgi:hypothetical protein